MSDDFSLCCWVRGTSVDATFIIKISLTETVDTLRNLVKATRQLDDVPASDLRLFKLKDPLRRPYKETLNGVTLSTDGELLDPSDEISEVFAAPPPKRHIHIIVGT
ncbi:hypothetical protein F5J12DRAFT_724822 [Pisolithus orientalis]|uniref:uncharacterized protein n=1 Tax=Pisolithus orientalis TaxID=936130 RepID=UPI002224CB90|nr:uncharacterized protein F5J12DRAFT_724822 [Pisolithus orientalis]KAI5998563.1 hypothetical protein F5J12DRAFT_724822 [Pisolithus orientalis]